MKLLIGVAIGIVIWLTVNILAQKPPEKTPEIVENHPAMLPAGITPKGKIMFLPLDENGLMLAHCVKDR